MSDAAMLARTTGEWRSVEALLAHLAERPASSFVLAPESAPESAAMFEERSPEFLPAVFASADAACRNELELLGARYQFGESIDWLRDPVTAWRWPLVHRSRVAPYLWSKPGVDPLAVWDLNRHQHFVALGIAYWLTNDERYAESFTTQLRSWIVDNPVQHGINWLYGLEVAIRLISWTVAFQFFRKSPTFRAGAGEAFLKSLWQQADFLSTHLQHRTTPGAVLNNHVIAEVAGLAIVGSAFPEFRRAAGWRDASLDALAREAVSQTHPDGVNKEQATGYHLFVAQLLLLIVARSRQGHLPPVPVVEEVVERMLDYLCGSVAPNGTAPMWGDASSGRALSLGRTRDFWDVRPLLSAGAALFARTDWKCAAGRFDEEAFWLLGRDGVTRWEKIDASQLNRPSRSFADAGHYVIRDAWTSDTDVGFFRCGPFGLGGDGHCAHAHCDLLSCAVWMRGEPFLVDSGTYTYLAPWRDRFRGTSAHNTVRVDGHDQATPLREFNWLQVPHASCTAWDEHRVQGRLTSSDGVEFRRELAHPSPGAWEVVDSFTGHAEHMLEWFFHFAPGLELRLHENHTATVLRSGHPVVRVQLPDGPLGLELRDGWYSRDYGVKLRNQELYARWQGPLDRGGVSFPWRFQAV